MGGSIQASHRVEHSKARLRGIGLFALFSTIAIGPLVHAEGSQGPVNTFYGSFGTDVAIEVPKFHGIEPTLKLSYASSGASGFAGVGWGLAGFSVIERSRPGRGAPSYDASDIFLLDGMELMADTSMGCQFSTRIKNYTCIKFDASNDQWTIIGTNGNKATYTPIYGAAGIFRWGLTSVSDLHGHTVTYGWWCDPGADCYPDKVTYNGTTIKIYREGRPDPMTFANGSAIGKTNYRLKSIDVQVGSKRARAYKLAYTTSGSSARSLLLSVQQFGTTASVDSNGTVSGHDWLPPMTMVSPAGGKAISAPFAQAAGLSLPTSGNSKADVDRVKLGDFNGDGRTDIAWVDGGRGSSDPTPMIIFLANADGTFTQKATGPSRSISTDPEGARIDIDRIKTGDFNGDGKTDLAAIEGWGSSANMSIYLSNGNGTFTGLTGPPRSVAGNLDGAKVDLARVQFADFNGDGKTDIIAVEPPHATLIGYSHHQADCHCGEGEDHQGDLCYWQDCCYWQCDRPEYSYSPSAMSIYLSNGDGSFTQKAGPDRLISADHDGARVDIARLKMGDFDGDGKTDMAWIEGYGTTNAMTIFLSNGDGTFRQRTGPQRQISGDLGWASIDVSRIRVGDFNGDGKADLAAIEGRNAGTAMTIYLSNGNGTFTAYGSGLARWVGDSVESADIDLARLRLGDFNGDGRTDIGWIEGWGPAQQMSIHLSHGDGTFISLGSGPSRTVTPIADAAGVDLLRVEIGDFNGDGKSDILANGDGKPNGDGSEAAGEVWPLSIYTSSSESDLVETLSNGTGGKTTLQYQPSSHWKNTYLPVGMISQTVASVTNEDGRGSSATTTYSYQRGLWSPTERRFLGFGYVKGIIDAAGNYTETYYHQGDGCISKPDATYFHKANGNLLSYSKMTYSENDQNPDPPYTSMMTARWDYEVDGAPAAKAKCDGTKNDLCRRIHHAYGYDKYGNVFLEYNYGDEDVKGDETTKFRAYYPNQSMYLISLPAYENVYQGIGTSGPLLHHVLSYYDQHTSYTTPPSSGNLTTYKEWNNQTGDYVTTTYDYDRFGNRKQTVTPLGVTSTGYDSVYGMFPTSECNALGQCTFKSWDTVLGGYWSMKDANGNSVTRTYDVFGRPKTTTRSDGSTETFRYDSWGDPQKQHIHRTVSDGSNLGIWTDTYLDGMQRIWRNVRLGGSAFLYQDILYNDGSQRKWKESDWYDPGKGEKPVYKVYAYDGLGRLATTTLADNSAASNAYYANAGAAYIIQTDELGHQHVVWKNANGQTIMVRERATKGGGCSVTKPCYFYSHYAYDGLDRLVKVTDALKHVTSTTFNSLGWKTQECDPDRGCISYTYDPKGAGNPKTRTDALHQTITYKYDVLGRLQKKIYPNNSYVEWKYDQPNHGAGIGHATSMSDSTGGESYVYDALGRTTSTTKCIDGTCYTLKRHYDAAGRTDYDTYPAANGDEKVKYHYDKAGRLSSIDGYVNSLTYDSNDHLKESKLANGVIEKYDYDAKRQWLDTATVKLGQNSNPLYQASYHYDLAGKIHSTTSTTNAFMNVTYSYDDLNRLIGVTGGQSQTFAYDAVGNMITNSALGAYRYDDTKHQHAITHAGSMSGNYSYNANGEMTQGGGRTITWSYDGQPLTVSKGGTTTTMRYDGYGRLVYQRGQSGTSYFFGPELERNANGLVKYYYAGPRRVAKRDVSGASWYHQDHLGSVKLITNSRGTVIEANDFAPFGKSLRRTGHVNDSFGFNGHRTEADISLVYMNSRFYDPTLGRFISPDSVIPDIGNPQALNRYSFVYNNPVSNTDPTGHHAVFAAIATFLAVVAIVASVGVLTPLGLTAILGGAVSIAGLATHNPLLSSIGDIMLGFAGGYTSSFLGGGLLGGLGGAARAALYSSISPLNHKGMSALGYALDAVGFIECIYNPPQFKLASPADPSTDDASVVIYNGGSIRNDSGILLQAKAGQFLEDKLTDVVMHVENKSLFIARDGPGGIFDFHAMTREVVATVVHCFSEGCSVADAGSYAGGITKAFLNPAIAIFSASADAGNVSLLRAASDLVGLNPFKYQVNGYQSSGVASTYTNHGEANTGSAFDHARDQ